MKRIVEVLRLALPDLLFTLAGTTVTVEPAKVILGSTHLPGNYDPEVRIATFGDPTNFFRDLRIAARHAINFKQRVVVHFEKLWYQKSDTFDPTVSLAQWGKMRQHLSTAQIQVAVERGLSTREAMTAKLVYTSFKELRLPGLRAAARLTKELGLYDIFRIVRLKEFAAIARGEFTWEKFTQQLEVLFGRLPLAQQGTINQFGSPELLRRVFLKWMPLISKIGIMSFQDMLDFGEPPKSAEEYKRILRERNLARFPSDWQQAAKLAANEGLDVFRAYRKYAKLAISPVQTIQPVKFQHAGMEIEVLPKCPLAAIAGNLTHCCQTIDGMAESCVLAALKRADAGVVVVWKDKRVIAQSFFWHTDKSFVFDNVEGRFNDATGKQIAMLYRTLGKFLIQEYGFLRVRAGLNYGKLKPFAAKKPCAKVVRKPEWLHYSDATHQVTVATWTIPGLTKTMVNGLRRYEFGEIQSRSDRPQKGGTT